jgi:hypothetical protein
MTTLCGCLKGACNKRNVGIQVCKAPWWAWWCPWGIQQQALQSIKQIQNTNLDDIDVL